MSDFYNDDSDNSYRKTVALCVAAASFVVLLFLVILYLNTDTKKISDSDKTAVESEEKKTDDFMEGANDFTSDELEFWDEKKEEDSLREAKNDEEGELTPFEEYDKDDDDTELSDEDEDFADLESDKVVKKKTSDASDDDDDTLLDEDDDIDRVADDEHIAVVGENGKKKYYEILSDVKKNDYDFENSLTREEGRLKYKDSKREAVLGVDLSKYNGNVDFAKLKEAGVNFAMLRLGSRGYGSGTITLDDKYVEYAQNAAVAGIMTGAYFYSSAINEAEAIEEANYIVGAVSGFSVKYPIAIDVEKVSGDTSRTEKLTVEERTHIVKTFCDTVKGFGYNPIIYSTRDMLISGLDLKELDEYDVWLSDDKIPTDYPYRFSMWQYSQNGAIQGIDGNVDLDLCFVKYEEK